MSILSDTMRMGASQPSADTAYQIEKGLRFNDPDSPKLTRTAGKGDTRKWTFSTWVKRGKIADQAPILSGKTSPYQDIYFTSGDAIACYIDSPNVNVRTSRLFRDPSAWMHIVIVWDTAQSQDKDRLRFYINGKRETSFDSTTWPSQYAESVFNRDGKDNAIFHGLTTSNDHFDGYGADPIFIDGLALSPGAFAEFSSAGVFNPKTFALPAPNTGVTFSSTVTTDTGSFRADHGATTLFDGLYNIACQSSSDSVGNWIKFTPATPIPFSQAIDVYQHGNTSVDYSWELSDGTLGYKTSGARTSTTRWDQEVILGSGKLKWLKVTMTAAAEYSETSMIRVDGVILRDGFTDPTTRSNPNNGTVWSNYLASSTGSFYGGMPATNAFNGSLSNAADASSTGGTMTFTPPSVITFDTLEMYAGGAQGGDQVITLTDSSDATTQVTTTVTDWVTVKSGGGTLKSLALAASSGQYAGWYGIRIDGHVLIDGVVDNSFHLKFNDTSSNAAIGYDSFVDFSDTSRKSINGAPILKTNHDGSAVTSGYRADANSSSLVLAVPGNTLTDVHGSVQGDSGNNISATNDNTAVITSNSKWYGSCLDFDSGDRLIFTDSSLVLGTGDFTIEGWFRWDDSYAGSWAHDRKYLWDNESSGTGSYGWARLYADGGSGGSSTTLKTDNATGSSQTVATLNKDQWYHIAMVRASGTMKVYVDGVEKISQSYTNNVNEDTFTVGAYNDDSGGHWAGQIQDFKVYTSAVYTAPFSVVRRNDFTVTNLTEAGIGSTTKICEVITYTGNGSNNRGITGVGFQPDFVLVKRTDTTNNWRLSDVMRGSGGDTVLYPDVASGEDQDGNILKSFDTDGFTVGTESHYNGSGAAIAAFCLKAGGAGSSNSDGSITSSVSVNASKSFSIVTWTGTGSNATVGHGLGKAPDMIWVKKRSETSDTWPVYTNQTGTNGGLSLEQAAAKTTDTTWFNDTAPTSTVFSVGTSANTNDSTETFVAYCFANTDGILKVGGYAGSSSDVTVDVGFTPKLVITKSHDTSGQEWIVKDSVRGTDKILILETDAAQSTARPCTFQTGSFTFSTGQGPTNWNGRNYVYLAIGDGTLDESGLDVLNDTPTNFEDGDVVRGNFCTLNPLSSAPDFEFSEGNLHVQSSGSGANSNHYGHGFGTMGVHSSSGGKFYFEVELTASDRLAYGFGIQKRNYSGNSNTNLVINHGDSTWANNAYTFSGASGSWRNSYEGGGSTDSSYGPNDVEGKVLGFAVDFSNDTTSGGEVFLTVDGTDQGNINSSALKEGLWTPVFFRGSDGDGMAMRFNFGQRSFKHLPSGFKGWCTQNLDDFDTDNDPSKFFDILNWTGTGSNDTDRKGLAFQPDLVWIKGRSGATEAILVDALRGATKSLNPAYGADEYTASSPHHEVQAFLSDGVTVGQNGRVNTSSNTYVGWFWDVGTAAATVNTSGSLDPSAAWVNATSGVNILKYTGNGSTSTIGHNLSAKPDWIIVKALANNYAWETQHSALGAEYTIQIQSNAAKTDSTARWNDTEPTASVFTVGDYANTNENGTVFMAYLFTAIPGFSAFGKYVGGNSDPNQAFVFTGFRPRFVMTKGTTLTDGSSGWNMYDSERGVMNPIDEGLNANLDNAEFSGTARIDFLSNGFKIRSPDSGYEPNQNETYVYMCWAQNPFKTSRAR